jgi:hypothetical protein
MVFRVHGAPRTQMSQYGSSRLRVLMEPYSASDLWVRVRNVVTMLEPIPKQEEPSPPTPHPEDPARGGVPCLPEDRARGGLSFRDWPLTAVESSLKGFEVFREFRDDSSRGRSLALLFRNSSIEESKFASAIRALQRCS